MCAAGESGDGKGVALEKPQGARKQHALLLPARELARHKVDTLGKADLGQLLDGDLLGLFLAALEHLLLRKHDVLFD